MIPAATGRAADSGVTVYAAAYQNGTDAATDTSLPEQVEVGGETKAVTWNLTGTEFPTAYERVSVTGTTADGSSVTAQVEVLPEKENQVVYFVDAAGESGGSKAFDAVRSLAGAALKNAVPDQAYDETSGWGRTNGSFHAKGADSVSGTDKYQTGYYGENNKANSLDYQYRLEAGTYIVTAGFYEWWSGPRKMKMTVSGEQVDSVSTEEYSVSSSSRKAVRSLRFTVKEESAVNMLSLIHI